MSYDASLRAFHRRQIATSAARKRAEAAASAHLSHQRISTRIASAASRARSPADRQSR